MSDSPEKITLYGAMWCGDCRRSKSLLDTLNVDYTYVDLEEVPEAADVAAGLAGRKNIPVISFPDGAVQCEPSDAELHGKLAELGVI